MTTTEKINDNIHTMTNALKETLVEQGAIPQVIVLFDDNGESHLFEPDQQEFIFTKMPKNEVKRFLKYTIEKLKTNGVNIIASSLFQCVYYKKADKYGKEELRKEVEDKHTRVKDIPGAEQALLVIRETKEEITMSIYDTIYNDDETAVVVSEAPVEENTMNKHENGEMNVKSWMVGFIE